MSFVVRFQRFIFIYIKKTIYFYRGKFLFFLFEQIYFLNQNLFFSNFKIYFSISKFYFTQKRDFYEYFVILHANYTQNNRWNVNHTPDDRSVWRLSFVPSVMIASSFVCFDMCFRWFWASSTNNECLPCQLRLHCTSEYRAFQAHNDCNALTS